MVTDPPPTQPQLNVSTSEEERIVLQTLKHVLSWAGTQDSILCSYVRVDRILCFFLDLDPSIREDFNFRLGAHCSGFVLG